MYFTSVETATPQVILSLRFSINTNSYLFPPVMFFFVLKVLAGKNQEIKSLLGNDTVENCQQTLFMAVTFDMSQQGEQRCN